MSKWVKLSWGDYLDVSRVTAIKVYYRGESAYLECYHDDRIIYRSYGMASDVVNAAREAIFAKIQNTVAFAYRTAAK